MKKDIKKGEYRYCPICNMIHERDSLLYHVNSEHFRDYGSYEEMERRLAAVGFDIRSYVECNINTLKISDR